MIELKGRKVIRVMLKKWKGISFLSDFLLAIAVSSFLSILLFKILLIPLYWGIIEFLMSFILLFIIHGSWKIKEIEVARFLNRMFPQMEESADLLLRSDESLNQLEKLQVAKIEKVITGFPPPKEWINQLEVSALLLLATIGMCFIIAMIPFSSGNIDPRNSFNFKKAALPKTEKVPASVASISIKIIPPTYTGKRSRQQNQLNLQVEENAEVYWQLSTTTSQKEMKFIFNDEASLLLQPLNKEHTLWAANKYVKETGFYQVQAGDKLSELYKIETIKDQPPVINMESPKPYTVIDFGQPKHVIMKVAISDDYGVASAAIIATIASGSGEAVKFKEQQLSFANFMSGKQQYQLSKLLDLPAVGLEAGDELYYYITARDTHGQENRSDIFIITLPDTAILMTLEGMTTGGNLVPEYFRSQRQIIIETEQLLREKDAIPLQQFNNRSNNLGLDQKLLRLRYGKFLGEETGNEIGGEDDHDQKTDPNKAHTDARDFGNASAIMDAFTHKHDNAEDASFFEPELKAQLKATLAEMWKAELQLRIYKPGQALPFEYKALRLLKDLQQKSRVYVAKTNYKTSPLKTGNRLTGDLDKIQQPVKNSALSKNEEPVESMRMAIPILEDLKNGIRVKKENIEILERASQQLNLSAVLAPAIYLASVAAMRRILEHVGKPGDIKSADIILVENAFQMILPRYSKLPVSSNTGPSTTLSGQYFKNLNRLRQ
ncbi:MAG: DUF4175 family protein [Chitinophagaceae bacterium]